MPVEKLLPRDLCDTYELKLLAKGDDGFYKYILGSAFNSRVDHEHPDVTLLSVSESFFSLFRQTGNDNYFTIGRIMRRAAHRLHRTLGHPTDDRFLHIVPKS